MEEGALAVDLEVTGVSLGRMSDAPSLDSKGPAIGAVLGRTSEKRVPAWISSCDDGQQTFKSHATA